MTREETQKKINDKFINFIGYFIRYFTTFWKMLLHPKKILSESMTKESSISLLKPGSFLIC